MELMLKKIGYKIKKIPFIPMSGFHGENLTKVSEKMPWYKGWEVNINKKEKKKGHTLVDALDTIVKAPVRKVEEHVRMPMSAVLKIQGVGDVVCGRIEQGIIKPGMDVGFTPSGAKGRIFSIEMHHRNVEEAGPGDNVGINVKGFSKDGTNRPISGDIMYVVSQGELKQVESFKAIIAVQEHPGQLKCGKDGRGGFTPSVHVRTAKAPCRMDKIHWKLHSKRTGGKKVDDPIYIQQGDSAEITMKPNTPLYCEAFDSCPGLGRLACMDSNSLVMLGKVTEVKYKE